MQKFTLEIEMGNDAMQDGEAVAEALGVVARKLQRGYTDSGILDLNGNRVGQWKITEDA